jgi:hypothetical protein
MAAAQKDELKARRTRRKPATTPEARELQLVSDAYDLAERQIQEGTASSQVITHFLKAGSRRESSELERLTSENELLRAKIDNMASAARVEELYAGAIEAMKAYSGTAVTTEVEDDY